MTPERGTNARKFRRIWNAVFEEGFFALSSFGRSTRFCISDPLPRKVSSLPSRPECSISLIVLIVHVSPERQNYLKWSGSTLTA
jgi:hypothetical protein